MALNSTGPISLAGSTVGQSIALELGRSASTTTSLNETDVRTLLGIAGGTISLSSAYGKSSTPAGAETDGGVLFILNQASGIRGVGRSGYHNEDVNYTDTQNQGPFGPYTTLNITTFGNNISRLYQGYFIPATTGAHRFRLISDDGSYMWLGSSAISGYTTENTIINNGGLHGPVTVTSGYWQMEALTYYPIRIVYGNGTGGSQLTLQWEGPGQAFTNNGTNRYFYNTATNGF